MMRTKDLIAAVAGLGVLVSASAWAGHPDKVIPAEPRPTALEPAVTEALLELEQRYPARMEALPRLDATTETIVVPAGSSVGALRIEPVATRQPVLLYASDGYRMLGYNPEGPRDVEEPVALACYQEVAPSLSPDVWTVQLPVIVKVDRKPDESGRHPVRKVLSTETRTLGSPRKPEKANFKALEACLMEAGLALDFKTPSKFWLGVRMVAVESGV